MAASTGNPSRRLLRDAAVGAIAVAPSAPNVIYVGTGEACIRGNVSHGDGVYRSDDGGRSWRNSASAIAATSAGPRDPRDPTPCTWRLWGMPGARRERGVFRSRDGGASWDHVLFGSERGGCRRPLAGSEQTRACCSRRFGQAQRMPWAMTSGGPDSGSGGPPTVATRGLTSAAVPGCRAASSGGYGVAVPRRWPARLRGWWSRGRRALRSDDGGATWQRGTRRRAPRPPLVLHARHGRPERCGHPLGGADYALWKSIDAARPSSRCDPHGDKSRPWIDPPTRGA